jgi:hypothetical protein
MGKCRVGLAGAILFTISVAGSTIAEAQRMAPVAGSGIAVSQMAHAQGDSGRGASTRSLVGRRNLSMARRGVHFNPATKSFVAADGSFVSLQEVLGGGPRVGSNYYSTSVLVQDPRIEATTGPIPDWRLRSAKRFPHNPPPFAGTIFYLPVGGGPYDVTGDPTSADSTSADQSAQQPQDASDQEVPPSGQPEEQPAPDQSEEPADVGQFILVLQNGTQLEAVAFTRMKDLIVYITADGSRRTIAAADLNSDATVQINQERGTPLQL